MHHYLVTCDRLRGNTGNSRVFFHSYVWNTAHISIAMSSMWESICSHKTCINIVWIVIMDFPFYSNKQVPSAPSNSTGEKMKNSYPIEWISNSISTTFIFKFFFFFFQQSTSSSSFQASKFASFSSLYSATCTWTIDLNHFMIAIHMNGCRWIQIIDVVCGWKA